MPQRILVAGIGNIFLGDDAFGVEVARRLARRDWPEGVRVVDFGIRGLDLAYALLDNYDAVILVDATPGGHPPGTLSVLELDAVGTPQVAAGPQAVETHGMDPVKVLRLAAQMGARIERVLLVGCEPECCAEPEEGAAGLSEPVRAAVEEAVPLIESLVVKIRTGGNRSELRSYHSF
jgi:hydrogenase maturation protease